MPTGFERCTLCGLADHHVTFWLDWDKWAHGKCYLASLTAKQQPIGFRLHPDTGHRAAMWEMDSRYRSYLAEP